MELFEISVLSQKYILEQLKIQKKVMQNEFYMVGNNIRRQGKGGAIRDRLTGLLVWPVDCPKKWFANVPRMTVWPVDCP